MKIFITGGTGLIGLPTCQKLLSQGHELMILTRLLPKSPVFPKHSACRLLAGDLSSLHSWKNELLSFKPEAALHLAWQDIPDYSEQKSLLNYKLGVALYKVLLEFNCKKFVTTGSCWEYKTKQGALTENMTLDLENPFTKAKCNLHAKGLRLTEGKDITFVWTRLFYVYGPRQKEVSLIPSLVSCISQGDVPQLKTPWTKNDFIYVDDVAQALCLLLENKTTEGTYNIASGSSTQISDIVNIISKRFSLQVVPKDPPSQTAGTPIVDFWGDTSRLTRELNWQPSTPLKDGINKYLSSSGYGKLSDSCPVCGSSDLNFLISRKGLPALNNITYTTAHESKVCIKGNVVLKSCNHCGFIHNSAFNPSLLNYDQRYDCSRSKSQFFNDYLADLVDKTISKVNLNKSRILEIGGGDGQFLKILCERSNSQGLCFDPSCDESISSNQVKFIKDIFNENYKNTKADLLILRHIMEHLQVPGDFLNQILPNITFEHELHILIEVPDVDWILANSCIWDITYEHCNYYSRKSIRNLLALHNIDIVESSSVFADQYLYVIGKVLRQKFPTPPQTKALTKDSAAHIQNQAASISILQKTIPEKLTFIGKFTVWGVSGKGVMFINLLPPEIIANVPFLIDINPLKQGRFCPGTELKIYSPEALVESQDVKNIVLLNPNYRLEVDALLQKMQLDINILTF